jgi:hypothetical protein
MIDARRNERGPSCQRGSVAASEDEWVRAREMTGYCPVVSTTRNRALPLVMRS